MMQVFSDNREADALQTYVIGKQFIGADCSVFEARRPEVEFLQEVIK